MDLIDFFFSTAPDQLPRTLVNIVITAIGVFSLLQLWRAWRGIRAEERALRTFDSSLSRSKNQEGDAGDRGEETARDRIRSAQQDVPANTIIYHRVDALNEVDRAGDDPDPSALVADVVSKLERRLSLVRWIANAVVLLGLFGTLLGLSMAVVSGQALVLEGTDSQQAVHSLQGTFTGLRTAFSATLLGLAFAIAIGLFLTLLRRRQTAFVEELESLSRRQLYPQYRSSPSDALARSARHLAEIEGHLQGALGNVIAGLSGVVDQLKTQLFGLTSTVDRSFSALVAESHASSEQLMERWDGVLAHQRKVLGGPEEAAVTLPEVAHRLSEAGSGLQNLVDGVGRVIPSLEEAIARQVDRGARDLHETLHEYSQRLTSAVERQESGVTGQLDRLREDLPGIEQRMVAALNRHETSLAENLFPAAREMTESLRSAQETSRALREVAERLERLNAQVDVTLRRAAESAGSSRSNDADRIVAAIEHLRIGVSGQGTAVPKNEAHWPMRDQPEPGRPVIVEQSLPAVSRSEPGVGVRTNSGGTDSPTGSGMISRLTKRLFG